MPTLVLDLRSRAVDLAVAWVAEGVLPIFDITGRVEEGDALWAEDVRRRGSASLCDFDGGRVGLDIGGRCPGAQGAARMAQALVGDTSLMALRLPGSHIGDEGARLLCRGLAAGRIELLDLGGNSLGDVACPALAQVLEKSTTLRSLLLGDNRIGCAGAASLAEGLAQSDFLTELDLSGNEVGDAGAARLAESLERNPFTLLSLDLLRNPLGEAGAARLRAAQRAMQAADRIPPSLRLGDAPSTPVAREPGSVVIRCSKGAAWILPAAPAPIAEPWGELL